MSESGALLALLLGCGFWAGAQNAVAGGGSFITLAALVFTGLDPKTANVASTVAMFPGQIASGWASRGLIDLQSSPSFAALVAASLAGGAVGAILLLATPPTLFEALVPWLVLFATGIFAARTRRKPGELGTISRPSPAAVLSLQFAVAIYGGYYSGGIGFLMLALLSLAGRSVHGAGALKNVLAGVLNSSAVLIFLVTVPPPWLQTAALGCGALAGGIWGVWLMKRLPEATLSRLIIFIGLALASALFFRQS